MNAKARISLLLAGMALIRLFKETQPQWRAWYEED